MENNLTNIQNITDNMNIEISRALLVPQWCRTTLIIFLAIVFITGLPGNALVLYVQRKTVKKTSTDWFVTCLAVADIMSLTISVPIYTTLTADWWLTIGSNFGCSFHQFVVHLTFISQTIIIACIAVDRLWKSNSIQQLFTPNRAFYCGLSVYGVSMLFGAAGFFVTHFNILGYCTLDPSRKSFQLILYTIIFGTVAVSSCITFYSYIRIIMLLNARNEANPVANSLRNGNGGTIHSPLPVGRYGNALRTTKSMGLVTIVFFVTTIISPIIAVIFLSRTAYRNSTKNEEIFLFFLNRLYLINNCLNPYFYFWLNTTFREKVRNIFRDELVLC